MFKVVVHDFGKKSILYAFFYRFHFVQYDVYNIVSFCLIMPYLKQLSRELNASQLCHVTACQTSVQNFVVFFMKKEIKSAGTESPNVFA